ncbi:DUF2806 domain-containing protein [Hymenobacter rubripertinctus]|uniref:DUF2806 domain-containing protein n=1 Tax=Hymenobacter rubripertinctus TaxID=2029981 RepID=A0A418QUZ0_9BACT|nr:DUF2806 domain-containing protein [Hymenobacter rubripertinctus]RIY08760.1 DUF2806 domain-containing protein [Hymenobacter rubripertinctus]
MDPINAGLAIATTGTALLGAKAASPIIIALLDKLSEASGIIFKPWQIRRNALAEADAATIKAAADIRIGLMKSNFDQNAQELILRAEATRMIQAMREQQNIDTIVYNALENINEKAPIDEIDADWVNNFFDKARLFSNEDIQNLWSQILAGEINRPSTFSRRTINTLSDLDKEDAELFRNLCSFTVKDEEGENIAIILNVNGDIYKEQKINYTAISHLDSIGLINLEHGRGVAIPFNENKRKFTYFENEINISLRDDSENKRINLNIGFVVLTKVGQELSKISQPVENINFIDYLANNWSDMIFNASKKDLPQ